MSEQQEPQRDLTTLALRPGNHRNQLVLSPVDKLFQKLRDGNKIARKSWQHLEPNPGDSGV